MQYGPRFIKNYIPNPDPFLEKFQSGSIFYKYRDPDFQKKSTIHKQDMIIFWGESGGGNNFCPLFLLSLQFISEILGVGCICRVPLSQPPEYLLLVSSNDSIPDGGLAVVSAPPVLVLRLTVRKVLLRPTYGTYFRW